MPQQSPGHWIKAVAQNATMEGLCAYERDGGRLSGETDEHLDALWVDGMRAWALVIYPRPFALDEAEAEMVLRGRKPPVDEVEPEIAAILLSAGEYLETQPREIVHLVLAKAISEGSCSAPTEETLSSTATIEG